MRRLRPILRGLILSSMMLILFFCEKRKTEFEYYENGEIKTRYNIVDGKRYSSFHYDSNTGYLSSERYYGNDTIIKYIDYFENGNIRRRGDLLKSGHFRYIKYYKNGKIQISTIFDKEGIILNEENYYENGMRDSIPYPWVSIKDVKLGMKVSLIGKVINILPSSIFNLEAEDLIIGHSMDTVGGTAIIRDTIAVYFSN